jgi:hypothetical protein
MGATMKYSLLQVVVDSRGNRGQIVDFKALDGQNFYQVLLDKDWATGKADFFPEENLRLPPRLQKAS